MSCRCRRYWSICIAAIALQYGGFLNAESQSIEPRWELGAGGGFLTRAEYPGAEEQQNYFAGFPYFVYRTEKFEATRDGVQGRLLGGELWGLGASFGFILPVDSDDNTARRGMDDIDPHFEIGPKLQWFAYQRPSVELSAELPVRAAINLSNGEVEGLTTEPRLVVRSKYEKWRISAYVAAIYSDSNYHDIFYTVDQKFAMDDRVAYRSSTGLTGTRVSFAVNHRGDRHLAGFFISHHGYSSAENRNSFLLRKKDTYSAGIVFTWLLKVSGQRITTLH